MAHDAAKLRELLERCQAASGPDRMLDAKLYAAFAPVAVSVSSVDPGLVHEDGYGPYRVDEFTASLDASIALVERMLPGWGRSVYWNNCQGYLCAVEDNENTYKGSTNQTFEAIGETAALALLAAMLKGLISQAEGEGA